MRRLQMILGKSSNPPPVPPRYTPSYAASMVEKHSIDGSFQVLPTEINFRKDLEDKLLYRNSLEPIPEFNEQLMEQHVSIYAQHVYTFNKLLKEFQLLDPKYRADHLVELRKRLWNEYNGALLHELFFENLKLSSHTDTDEEEEEDEEDRGDAYDQDLAHNTNPPPRQLSIKIEESFGGLRDLKKEVVRRCDDASIQWILLCYDAATGNLCIHFIHTQDEDLSGLIILLVIDMWEHAYLLSYGVTGRRQYVSNILFKHVDWQVVLRRFNRAALSYHTQSAY